MKLKLNEWTELIFLHTHIIHMAASYEINNSDHQYDLLSSKYTCVLYNLRNHIYKICTSYIPDT